MGEVEQTAFEIILHAGNCRSLCMEANESSREYEFEKAEKILEEAEKELQMAHQVQTTLIQQECSGNGVSLSLLMVHAQDHINNAMQTKDSSEEFLNIYKKIFNLERKVL